MSVWVILVSALTVSLLTQDVGDGKMGETKRDQGRREFRKIQSEVLKLKL